MPKPVEIPELAIDWSGTWTGSSWGVSSKHHPRSHSHDHLDPDFHSWTAPWSMHIVQQDGRHLDILYKTDNHESRAVAVITADLRKMILTGEVAIYHFELDLIAGTMWGQGTARPHGTHTVGTHFACGEVEIAAIPKAHGREPSPG